MKEHLQTSLSVFAVLERWKHWSLTLLKVTFTSSASIVIILLPSVPTQEHGVHIEWLLLELLCKGSLFHHTVVYIVKASTLLLLNFTSVLDPAFPSQLKGSKRQTSSLSSFLPCLPSLSLISSHSFQLLFHTSLFYFHFFLFNVSLKPYFKKVEGRTDPETPAIAKVAYCLQFPEERYMPCPTDPVGTHRAWSEVRRSKGDAWVRARLVLGAEMSWGSKLRQVQLQQFLGLSCGASPRLSSS